MPSTNYKANWKKAISKKEINQTLWGGLGVVTYVVIPSIIKRLTGGAVDGWGGYAIASGGTFLAGALFDIPGLRYSAVALSLVHLAYAKFSNTMSEIGIPVWRMGGDLAFSNNTSVSSNENLGLASRITSYDLPSDLGYSSRPANELSGYGTIPNALNDYGTINSMSDYGTIDSLSDYGTIDSLSDGSVWGTGRNKVSKQTKFKLVSNN